MNDAECIIWGTPATYLGGYEGRDGSAFLSPRAGGRYFISRSAAYDVANLPTALKVKLTHEIVSGNILGLVPEILSSTIESLKLVPPAVFTDRIDRLLDYLIKQSLYIGRKLTFPMNVRIDDDTGLVIFGFEWGTSTAPLFAYSDSSEQDEVQFLIEILISDGLIRVDQPGSIDGLVVLPSGYSRAERNELKVKTSQVFVAMWFDTSMFSAYSDGIDPAIRECGYSPVRIDQLEHINKIDDEIVAEIRRSRFLVADFTSEIDKPRGGVYFEAGFALGLGIPVIWLCRADQINNVHFDTRQFNHIVWQDAEDLKRKLIARISAVIV